MIDLYCERIGPGLWAEPLNVVSNIAYVVAAAALARRASQQSSGRAAMRTLAVIVSAIAAGSAAFHVWAEPWARMADEVPIAIFEVSFLWIFGRQVLAIGRGPLVVIVVALLATSAALRAAPPIMNGTLPYAPALVAMTACAAATAHRSARAFMLAATSLFAVGVVLRTIDNVACAWVPVGTHFIWHLSTAVVL